MLFVAVEKIAAFISWGIQKMMLLRRGTGGQTMAEYIEREKLSAKIGWDNDIEKWTINDDELCSIPAADVAPVRHGRWIMRGGKLHCSNCDSLAPLKRGWEDGCTTYEYTASRYCPNCGVKMDGGETS